MSQRKLFDRLFEENKLSRRDFIQGAAAFGITATAASGIWAKKAAAAPKKGGHFRMGMAGGATSDSMDPGQILDTYQNVFNYALRNTLVGVDHMNNAQGELAESFESSPDAKVWTFKLRQGVTFHNGKDLDAEDVISSLNYHRSEESKSAAKSILDQIVDIKAKGKDAVVFELSGGNADFPYVVSDYHLSIVPAGTTDFSDGMGTGAYIFESFEPGVRSVAKRNPNYWNPDRGHFDSIETIGIADVNARTNALKSGEIDVMNRCDVKTLKLLARVPSLQIIQGDGFKHSTLPMLQDAPPYNNADVRLGLKYAINREEILEKILRGYGSVGNDTPISKNSKYFNSDLPQRPYDPDKARFHMKKAGMENQVFNLHVADGAFEGAVDTGILYKEHAAAAGININVVREPNDGYWSNVWQSKEWCASYWSGRPTQDWMWSLAYAAGAAWSETNWANPRFNELLVQARAELDEKLRHEIYNEMQVLCHNDCGAVIPIFGADLNAANKNCMFENYAANLDLDGAKIAERWWFA